MFQAKKWSWKRVAANLLLVPVLSGGSVAVVHAQLGRTNSGAGMPTSQPTATTTSAATKPTAMSSSVDPKQLLKDGRKALAERRFADAQDLAQAAESHNPGGKWGLFDDTPAALRKDIETAKAKSNKAKAEQLTKDAKALAHKPVANDAERAYNLDNASQMARKADQLHGPYSTWDMGERPDKLVKELQDARAKLKVASTKPPATPPGTPGTGTGSPAVAMQPKPPVNTAGMPPTNVASRPPVNTGVQQVAATDPRKAGALKLMAEGKAMADQGNFAAAKTKYIEADKLGATFAPGEYSPGFALQELNTRGAAAMDKLVRDAQGYTAQKDYAKANASLTNAGMIAATLGLFPKPVAEAKAALFISSGGKFGTPPPSGMAAAGGPEYIVPAGSNTATAPGVPPGTATVYGKPGTPSGPGGTLTGRQLLDQAAYEFSRGEFDTAERLAIQAHNLGVQEEARGLLNSIGAEKLAQKKRVAVASLENAKASYQNKEYQRTLGVLVLIDPMLLPVEAKDTREQLLTACKVELDKTGTGHRGGRLPPAACSPIRLHCPRV